MWHVLALGFLFFPGLYLLIRRCAHRIQPQWSEADCSLFSSRIVSSVHAIAATTSGILITSSIKDVKSGRHWLATTFIWIVIPYMVYDALAMFLWHWYKCKEKMVTNGKDHFSTAMNSFLQKDFLMLVHHTAILTIFVPIDQFVRGDIGDFYVGCLFLAETSTPFLCLGKILIQMNLQNSLLHKVNGIFILLSFFTCRILLFPFMYNAYAKQYGIPIYKVPFNIPLHCNISNATLMAPQIYWFWLICRKALRLYKSSPASKDR
ncbi:TLC domain-containing protein 3A [Bombina bombina]|uniref:TLC domain-containing protein 3A n=1 Tax=Bombina bombina TaxID=8345 RepID=UPI00235AAB27|nr:TLC domain-containing protein 3A [Bombina bombina]